MRRPKNRGTFLDQGFGVFLRTAATCTVDALNVEVEAMAITLQLLALLLLCLSRVSFQANFSFTNFDATSGRSLIFRGSAQLSKDGNFVDLTRTNASAGAQTLQYNSGRMLYGTPLTVWPASFTTTFTVIIANISTATTQDDHGDGLAFLITPHSGQPLPGSYGSFLGLFDTATDGNTTAQLAVELDTIQNEFDPDSNHAGVDTAGIRSDVVASLTPHGIFLASGRPVSVRVSYDGWSHMLGVHAAYADGSTDQAFVSVLNHSIFLSETLPRTCYVGFSAGTGITFEMHRLLNWRFSSQVLPASSLPRTTRSVLGSGQVVALVLGCTVAALLLVAAATVWRARKKKEVETESMEAVSYSFGPRRLAYQQLCAATGNFSDAQLLGRGGFGSVYRGIIIRDCALGTTTVAVKRIKPACQQAQRGFQAELTSMSRLRHRNLVRLLGWCHYADELLLVYEHMPNGSLDRHIFTSVAPVLPWARRQRVLEGLAAALLYLHEEWEQRVIHRDVKPSNVLLDADFNARLGDFGLARLAEHDCSLRTAAAGTVGHVAPECMSTGQATAESDVFSFGIVALEVATGRRAGLDGDLVERVWKLQGNGRVVEAADERLGGQFEAEQMARVLGLGLACCHPDPRLRPSMRQAVRMLTDPCEPLPQLCACRPTAIYVIVSSSEASSSVLQPPSSSTPASSSSLDIRPNALPNKHKG